MSVCFETGDRAYHKLKKCGDNYKINGRASSTFTKEQIIITDATDKDEMIRDTQMRDASHSNPPDQAD